MIEWWGPVIHEFYGYRVGAVTFANCGDALQKPGTVGRIAPVCECGLSVTTASRCRKVKSAKSIRASPAIRISPITTSRRNAPRSSSRPREPRRQRARARAGTSRSWLFRPPPARRAACADEGPGFPAGFAARAFDRFSRADEASRGAGAVWARDRAVDPQAHSGEAGVSQTPGARTSGSRFRRARAIGEAAGRRGYVRELEQRRLQGLLERLARVRRAGDLWMFTPGAQELLAEHRERLRHDVLRAARVEGCRRLYSSNARV